MNDIKIPVKLILKGALGLLVIFLLFGCFEVISPSERAVKVTLGTASNHVYGPGVQLKWPIISHFSTYDLKPNADDLIVDIGQGGAISSDNQIIGASAKVVWAYDSSRIMEIVQKYPDTSQLSKLVNSTVYEALKAEIGKYTIFELAKNAGKIASDAKAAATTKLAIYPVVFTQFNLTNWDWSKDFDAQINATIAAQQQVAKARANADRVEQEQRAKAIEAEASAKALVAQATGEKAAAELRADAKKAEGQGIADYNRLIAQNLDTELKFRQLDIDKIRAQRWNGAQVSTYLPLTAGGGIVSLPAAGK